MLLGERAESPRGKFYYFVLCVLARAAFLAPKRNQYEIWRPSLRTARDTIADCTQKAPTLYSLCAGFYLFVFGRADQAHMQL